jgi:uncharacterized protein
MIAARASLLALLVCWAFAAAADVAVPPLSGRVIDQTGTLSASDVSSLTQTLRDLETRKGSQVAVLIVPTTAPEAIEQYSIRVAEAWKIGRKKIDDGALLVVAKDDRKLRIEVGYGLEGSLTDATASRIIDEIIVPRFRSGDFAGGISLGVNWIFAVIDGEKLPAPQARPSPQSPQWSRAAQSSEQRPRLGPYVDNHPLTLVILFLVAATFYTVLGRWRGSLATAGLVGVLVWYFWGFLAPAFLFAAFAFFLTYLHQDGWSGRSSLSESSSSDGGSSGGGGSFGGGGATGSW